MRHDVRRCLAERPRLSAGLSQADPAHVSSATEELRRAGVSFAHIDVSDGSFGAPSGSGLELELIAAGGAAAGVALCPGTPVGALEGFLEIADLVLVLAVDPRTRRTLPPQAVTERLKAVAADAGDRVVMGVDGRVTPASATEYVAAGARLVVAGRALFEGDLRGAIESFQLGLEAADTGTPSHDPRRMHVHR